VTGAADETHHAFKLVDRTEWEAARASGAYEGSTVDRADGYIHLSTADQVAATAAKYFAGQDDLVLARVDLMMLVDLVKWEPSRGGALFPHIYGPLPFSAVRHERRVEVLVDGRIVDRLT
jgi:Uncharacterized protein conserved in bacteria